MIQDRLELEGMLQVLSNLQKADMFRLCGLRTEGVPKAEKEDQDEVLQTTMVALKEIQKDIAVWTPAMQGKHDSFAEETQAIEPVSVCDLDDGQVEHVPRKEWRKEKALSGNLRKPAGRGLMEPRSEL